MKNKVIILITALVWLSSCRNNRKATTGGILPTDDPEVLLKDTTVVSFNNQILPVLTQNCATSGCHSGSQAAAGFNLDPAVAYKTLTRKGSGYVDTLTPKYSVLYSAMVSQSSPMPPTGPLEPAFLQLIQKWMLQKAKNN